LGQKRFRYMRKILALFCALLFLNDTTAQNHWEVGPFGGVSYYIGDLNPERHFPSSHTYLASGFFVRKNLNSRWAIKGGVNVGQISADDADSKDDFQLQRNLSFFSNLYEANTTLEFNFLPFNPFIPPSGFRMPSFFTPYVFIGIGVFRYNPRTTLGDNIYDLHKIQTEGQAYVLTQFAMPFGAGFKFKISERILLTLEWGIRRTFTDYLDDVSKSYPSNPDDLSQLAKKLSDKSLIQQGGDGTNWGTQRGNSKTTDWYSFSGITLTINLNKNPSRCYFGQDK